MAKQLTKILKYAEKQIGSRAWHGYCQAFVASCYEAGRGYYVHCYSANIARDKYMKSGTASDLYPPAGAAVYFNGDGERGKIYGHTALSAGGGVIYDPVSIVKRCRLTSQMHNGYLGWGWLDGMPEGAKDSSGNSNKSSHAASAHNESVEIMSVQVISESGKKGLQDTGLQTVNYENGRINILIQNNEKIFAPVVVNTVSFSTSEKISAGILKFTVIDDGIISISNGNSVAFRYDGKPVFYGYVFTVEKNGDDTLSVVCYDQLRYLKNKDSMVYNCSYSDLIKQIAYKYGLQTGYIEDTGYVIPSRIEEDSVINILNTAAHLTSVQTGGFYVLYDDFGRLTLKPFGKLNSGVYLDSTVMTSYSVKRDIDNDVYNRVVIAYDNSQTGVRELYIANDTEKQSKWGVLQYYERNAGDVSQEELQRTSESILKDRSVENVSVSVKSCAGDLSVRGGCGVYVRFPKDEKTHYMVCEKAEHIFGAGEHTMNLELSGGMNFDGK